MNNRIKEAFDSVHAEESLKEKARSFLAEKTAGYSKRTMVPFRKLVPAAACLLLFLAGGHWLYFTPTASISIDINPSVELDINRFDRVISAEGLNDDGEKLTESLQLTFTGYSEALTRILESEQISSLLSDNAQLSITVIGSGDAQSARLLSAAETCAAGHENAHCYTGNYQELEAAHQCGLSYGKYRAFLQLQEADPDITPEEIQGMTMRELQDRIDGCSQQVPDSCQTPGHGHHRNGCSP